MRVLLRRQEARTNVIAGLTDDAVRALGRAITDGIRGAEIQNAVNAHRRAVERLRAVDEATGGALCKNIDKLIEAEAAILNEATGGTIEPDIKKVRTEIGRLAAYIRYRDYCHNPPTGE